MFVCLLEDESVIYVEDTYCDIGNFKIGYLYDENGKKVEKWGILVDILQYYDDWN